MVGYKDLSTVRRRRTVEIEEEEIEDDDVEPIRNPDPVIAKRSFFDLDGYKPGIGLYILIGAFSIFFGFLFAMALSNSGGASLPLCSQLPSWNQDAPCR